MSEELLMNEIENNKDEYIEFLRELIQAESYNPPGNEKKNVFPLVRNKEKIVKLAKKVHRLLLDARIKLFTMLLAQLVSDIVDKPN